MRNILFLLGTVVSGAFISAPAQAQWSNSGYGNDLIRCESRDGRTQRCETYGGDVQLVRQLSGNPCIRGRTWGTDSRGVWVSSGCRAEFRVDAGDGYNDNYGNGYDDDDSGYGSGYGNNDGYGNTDGLFRCESRTGRTERCNSSGRRAQLIRQLSNTPCVRGQTWGSDSRGVWVSNGCRALFSADNRYGNGYGGNDGNGYGNGYGNSYGNDLVRCESRDNRSHSCAISGGRSGSVRLLRQLSGKPCIENQTWGRSRTGVWVTQGCRAEFVSGRGGSNRGGGYQRPPGQRPPGDLGGTGGGKRQGVFADTSPARPPGDLGIVVVPTSERPMTEERERPPVNAGRPGTTDDMSRPQARPVEEAPGRIEAQPVEDAPVRTQRRPAEEAPGRVEQSGTTEPEVEAIRQPRDRGVQQAERPL